MFPGFELDHGFRLSLAEVHVISIRRNWQIEVRQVRIDKQVMVSGRFSRNACGSNAHVPESEHHAHRTAYNLSVCWSDNVDRCISRCVGARQISADDGARRKHYRQL